MKATATPTLSLQTLDNLASEDLVLWVASDERPLRLAAGYVDWRANGWLSRLIQTGQFRCARGEKLLTLSAGRINCKRLFLVGLGEGKSFHVPTGEEIGVETAKMLQSAAATNVAIGLPGVGDADAHAALLSSMQKLLPKLKLTTWGPWRKS